MLIYFTKMYRSLLFCKVIYVSLLCQTLKTIKMKYVSYQRVSTKRQGESGLGLEAQETIINYFFTKDEIVASFTENKTAKTMKNRHELLKALEYCKTNDCTLVVAKLDRLSRSMADFEFIYSSLNGKLHACDTSTKGTQTDKSFFQMRMIFAEKERELISIRTKQALMELKKRGVKLGYDRAEVKKGIGKSDKINSSEIGGFQANEANENINTLQVAQKIVDFNKAGLNFSEIARELSKRNGKGELINKYPNYGKEKKGKVIKSDWQAIQVQRIFNKYKQTQQN